MEGVASEAASLGGHLQLGNLIVVSSTLWENESTTWLKFTRSTTTIVRLAFGKITLLTHTLSRHLNWRRYCHRIYRKCWTTVPRVRLASSSCWQWRYVSYWCDQWLTLASSSVVKVITKQFTRPSLRHERRRTDRPSSAFGLPSDTVRNNKGPTAFTVLVSVFTFMIPPSEHRN